MSARYEVGEHVDVLIRNARVVETDPWGVMVERDDMDASYFVLAAVTVTRVAPKEWPPVPGDIWEAVGGQQWFARADERNGTRLVGSDALLASEPAEAVLHDGPLRLMYRRGWSPKPEPAGPPAVERLVPEDPRAATILGLRDMVDWLEANPSVPLPYYDAGLTAYVDHDPAIDKAAAIEVLHRASEATGIDLDGNMHLELRKTFAGRARYNAILCNWATPDEPDEDLPGGGGEEAAGLVGPVAAPSDDSPGRVEEAAGSTATALARQDEPVTAPADKWAAVIPNPHPLENCGPLTLKLAPGDACPTCGTVPPAESSPAGPVVPADDPPADAVLGVSRPLDRSGPAADSVPGYDGDGAAVTPDVWVPRRRAGINYHRIAVADVFTTCGRAARASGSRMPLAEAKVFGAVPCPRCFGGPS